jgi:multiple sugar transport system permease protein
MTVTTTTLDAPRAGGGSLTAGRRRRQGLTAWLFSLPFLLIFGGFMVVPLLGSFFMSFTDMKLADLRTPFAVNFVGIEQYQRLFGDARFLRALANTFGFAVVAIPVTVGLGLLLAVGVNNGITRLRSVFRLGFYAPVVTSVIAIAVVWRYILQPDGLLNTMLGWLGIDGPNWLADPHWALPAIVGMWSWHHVGNMMVIFLAGLQAVSPDVLEAARVDGANAFQRFFRITLPLLRPTVLLGFVLLSISSLQLFEEPFVMTQGGPLDATLSVTYFTFNQFGFGNYGFSAAASYVLFVVIALLSLLQFRLLRSKD